MNQDEEDEFYKEIPESVPEEIINELMRIWDDALYDLAEPCVIKELLHKYLVSIYGESVSIHEYGYDLITGARCLGFEYDQKEEKDNG